MLAAVGKDEGVTGTKDENKGGDAKKEFGWRCWEGAEGA